MTDTINLAAEPTETVRQLAEAGDPNAKCELGLRLIEGDRAPECIEEGRSLVVDAALHGSAEAAYRHAGEIPRDDRLILEPLRPVGT